MYFQEREEKQKQQEAAQKEAEVQEDESNVFLKNIESVQRRPKQESPKSECVDKRQVFFFIHFVWFLVLIVNFPFFTF